MFEFYEAKRLKHALMAFLVGKVLFHHAVGDIFFHGQGIKESAFLEDDPILRRNSNNSSSFIAVTSLPRTKMRPLSGFMRPRASFRMVLLPAPRDTEDGLGFATGQAEGDSVEDHLVVKRQRHILEADGFAALLLRRRRGRMSSGKRGS